MTMQEPFYVSKGNIHAVPILHYKMEMAAEVRHAFKALKPDCVAVELPETMQLQCYHAASRLPDISVIVTYDEENIPLYIMSEPCEPTFEALRSALESQIPAYCIDLDVEDYPDVAESFPDSYAAYRIGLKNYYEAYLKLRHGNVQSRQDRDREFHMAKRLKELSLSHDRILFVGGMAHIENVLALIDNESFPDLHHANREVVQLCTLNESSCRDVMAETGWISTQYELHRGREQIPDRQKCIYDLFKAAGKQYVEETGNDFPGYCMRNLMKFGRNYAAVCNRLMPDFFQLLNTAKGCVDHNYAYEVWVLATQYDHRRNIDSLPELDLTIEDVWGGSQNIRFHLKMRNPKSLLNRKRHKQILKESFFPPNPYSICSYPPEDVIIERFGEFLKKKGVQMLTEESARTVPFNSSIEDGIDIKETIRHWHENKLYVRTRGKPIGDVGSVVIIFDQDLPGEDDPKEDHYPWHTTWIGEHAQESDMAFYATPLSDNVIGPGISRCEYGGFMLSYPPRRLYDVWSDPDYGDCRSKSEVLLMAAIDYATEVAITYVASKPPRSALKSYAQRFGKKIVYLPIGQLSPTTLNKLRVFHVLDGHSRRENAGDFIF